MEEQRNIDTDDAGDAPVRESQETGLQYVGNTSDTSSHHNSEEDEGWEDDDEEEQDVENPDEIFRRIAAENRITTRSIKDDNLPSTVTVLDGTYGEKIYLIGTAHFSIESCDDVRKVIRDAQPDVVMIELCRGRTDILHNDEKKLVELAGEVNSTKIFRQIREKGVVSGLMTFFLLHMSAHITKQLGMAPGSEFRTAYQEARRIPGCKVMFGDRAVEVTLQRAFAELSIWQRLKFVYHSLKDLGPIKAEDIEKLKQKDLLEQALGEMMEQFPQMTKVFLGERDIYLARSLQLAAGMPVPTKEGVAPPVVVAVVGLGHAAGVAEHFKREIDFEETERLMEVPKPSNSSKILKRCTKFIFAAICVYSLYRISSSVTSVASFMIDKASTGVSHLISYANTGYSSVTDKEL